MTLAGKTLTMKENETLEVFSGAEAPRQRIISSRTFAENIGLLSAYLAPDRNSAREPGVPTAPHAWGSIVILLTIWW